VLSALVGARPDLIEARIRQLASPFHWSALAWEAHNLPAALDLVVRQLSASSPDSWKTAAAAYLDGSPRDNTEDLAQVLTLAVAGQLRARGVTPLGSTVWPPVAVAVSETPRLLVVSPRHEIRTSHWLLLSGAMPMPRAVDLERAVERAGVSAYVVEGVALGIFPALIPSDLPPRYMLRTIAHEWTHTALFPSPLGRLYGASTEARAINETTADIVGQEIELGVLRELNLTAAEPSPQGQSEITVELRKIRLRVDELLRGARIAEAEVLMESERLRLVGEGYRLRRLNQAYFAFHGNYAEGPSASTEVLDSLVLLRKESRSLGDFLARVGQLTSVSDLRRRR
jgi:hypothetical protein